MSKIGIMIIGHGSRYRYNQRTMELQAERLRDMGFENVYIGYNETAHPFIQETLKQMVDDGIDEVIAAPFFIASGLHMTKQICTKLLLQDGEYDKEVEFEGHKLMMHFEKPFGDDPMLAKLIHEKYMDCRDTSVKSGLMVIGHGSRINFNSDVIKLNAQRLKDMGHENVYYAFNEFNEPRVEEVMDQMVGDGMEEIVVVPIFISEGDHLKNDIPPKIHLVDGIREGTFEQDGRTIGVKYCLPLGNDFRLTNILAEKIRKHM
jgi:sirohydrochlorin cobaltochelatase